jgi:hypothetical protein
MQLEDVSELIQEIKRHELTLAKMYYQFAKSHPGHDQFWSKLAREETIHAKMIESLERHYKKGHIGLSDFKLSVQALKTSISHLEKKIEESKNGNLSLRNAVSIALDIEKSMIDNKFFEIFDLVCGKQERIRLGLEKETLKHRQHLEKLFSELNKN